MICCSSLQIETPGSLSPLLQLLALSRTMSSFQKEHLPPERTCQIIPHYLISFRLADIFHSGNVGNKIANIMADSITMTKVIYPYLRWYASKPITDRTYRTTIQKHQIQPMMTNSQRFDKLLDWPTCSKNPQAYGATSNVTESNQWIMRNGFCFLAFITNM